jgi:DNA invertase Pin-like site-specific DNA recombinase
MTTNDNYSYSDSSKEARRQELLAMYGKYRGLRALLLTRVSTGSQSHDAQERIIRDMLIDLLDLQLDEERHVLHSTYTGLEYRYHEALDEILRMAERHEFDVLCLDVLDRGLGRKGVSREVFRGQLRELGIHILTTEPSDHSDDDSLEGQLMRLLKGYKAEEEVNDFVRRSKNGMRYKALGDPEKGIPPKVIGNTSRLYGYKYVLNEKGQRVSLEPNYDVVKIDRKGVAWTEVRVMIFMFRCAKHRIPMWRIAKRLNTLGIPSPSASKGLKITSKGVQAETIVWQVSLISRMLRNPSYSGKYIVNKFRTTKIPGRKWRQYTPTPLEERIIVPIPAIVSEEMQEEVIENLERNRKNSKRNSKLAELALLRGGLGKCGHCGRNLALQVRYNYYHALPKDQPPVMFYRCGTKSSGTQNYCPGCYIKASILDKAIWEKALEIIHDPSIVNEAIESKKTSDPTAGRRKQINKALKELEEERNNLQANLLFMTKEKLIDRDTAATFGKRLKEIEKLVLEYQSELLDDNRMHQEWERAQREIEKLHKKCADMREKLRDPNYEPDYQTKRDLIELFGITATVWDQKHYKVEASPSKIMLQLRLRV